MRLVLVLAVLVVSAVARADGSAVALLPLDADQRLEIYGQPVASELARALVAGGVDVVVVGKKMAVPERAKLIVDGTIAGKGEVVTLTLRIRNPVDGTQLATTSSSAQGLANIDKAAADLSAKLLPLVKTQLAALEVKVITPPPVDKHPVVVEAAPPAPLVFAVAAKGPAGDPLRTALTTEATPWSVKHHRALAVIEAGNFAPAAVKAAHGDLAVGFEVLSYSTGVAREIPTATARVRVRVADASAVIFDRVVVTDTVVGDKGISPVALAERTARDVLDIVRPHLARLVPSWQ